MKKMQILLVVTLICCCICFGAVADIANGTCGDNLAWKLDDAGKLTVSGTGAMKEYSTIEYTWRRFASSILSVEIQSGVTSIGGYAFSDISNIKNVTLGDGVTSIGKQAFFQTSLTGITIPGSVTDIGQLAFGECKGLTHVTIQDNSGTTERQIGAQAFYGCSVLESVTIGTGLTSIGTGAFSNCKLLKSATLSAGVTSIGTNAFVSCSALKDIYFCGSQTEWDNVAKDQGTYSRWDLNTPSDKTIHVFTFAGTGMETDVYKIKTEMDWNTLADFIANGSFETAGKHFLLDVEEALSVSTMIGTKANPFKGIFDGNGKTLTVEISASENIAGTFRYIKNATIQNLLTDGTIITSKKFAGGFVGLSDGNCTITNCRSSVAINSSVSGDGTHGGLVACMEQNSGLIMEGCLFSGQMLGASTTKCGGLVGYGQGSLTIKNCVFDTSKFEPTTGSENFARTETGTVFSLENCYYKHRVSEQGKRPYRILPGSEYGLVLDTGKGTEYDVSGIIAFPAGLYYGYSLIAGEGDEVPLFPHCSIPDGSYAQYYGNETLLTRGAGDAWMLTMPANTVLVNALISTVEPYGNATFTLPTGIKNIGQNAFTGIKATVVYVPDTCKKIEAYAFRNCPNLKQIRLPKDCEIDDAAFFGCTELMAIYSSGDGTTKDWAVKNRFGYMTAK